VTYDDGVITFIESPLFTRQVYDYLSDEEYAAFQAFLANSPDAGDIVKGSGVCVRALKEEIEHDTQ